MRNQSITWTTKAISPFRTDTIALDLETNLGYSVNGDYGFDTVALGWQGSGGPSLDHQLIAGIADKRLYFGVFGLSYLLSCWGQRHVLKLEQA